MATGRNERAVEELFLEWAAPLARYAYRVTRNRALADELVQEAFLALYRRLESGETVENARAWTLAVVRRQACKLARTSRRHAEVLESGEALDRMPSHWTGRPEGEDDVERLLSFLTPREEDVVLLRMESLKYREIAQQLGIDIKSVGTLLARAVRKLQKAASGGEAGAKTGRRARAGVSPPPLH